MAIGDTGLPALQLLWGSRGQYSPYSDIIPSYEDYWHPDVISVPTVNPCDYTW